jgi:hypothetical protein
LATIVVVYIHGRFSPRFSADSYPAGAAMRFRVRAERCLPNRRYRNA